MEVIRKEVCQRTDPVLCWLQVAISNTGCRLVSEKCINASSSYYTDPFMEIRWKRKCLLEETKRSRQEVRGARCEVRSCRMWLVIQVAGFPAGHSKPPADNSPTLTTSPSSIQTTERSRHRWDGHPSSLWQSPGLCTTLKHPVDKGAPRRAFNGRIRHLHTLSLISSAPTICICDDVSVSSA